MRRLLLPLVLLVACAGRSSAGPAPILKETVDVGAASLNLELTHEPRGARTIELRLRMQVSGMEETDKLAGDVSIAGFNVEEGSTHWDGFVPPRQPQTFSVLLSIPEGSDSAKATVKLVRSQDSFLLLREEIEFTVNDRGVVEVAR